MPPLLVGIALGAAGAFMFDPQQGRRRRALVRDKFVRGMHESRDFADAASRDIANRSQGIAARMRSLGKDTADDDILAERVRAKLGRYSSHPKAIEVTVGDARVVLTGDVLAREHMSVVQAARMVRGVKDVEDRLDVHRDAENVPSLQGGTQAYGERGVILQRHWSPATRALSMGAGAAVVLYALARRGRGRSAG